MLTIEQISEAEPRIIAEMKKLDPIRTAASFAGLLATPELQANCFRIEVLVHLAVAYCRGQTAPTKPFVQRAFERLGPGFCGAMEDPAEDVFATLVNTPQGNFRIFEGIRVGTGFHLQRILGVLATMPERAPYTQIRSSIYSMLRLSDEIAERAGVRENLLGREIPCASFPVDVANHLAKFRGLIQFSEEDLTRLGIAKDSLNEFIFDPRCRPELAVQKIGHTDLERRPVALHGKSIHLLLPTAVASAISRFVIETVLSMRMDKIFEENLCGEFAELFDQTPILGGATGAPLQFQKIPGGQISSVMTKVDRGRLLYLVFFVDGLGGFLESGLSEANADPDALSSAVAEHLKQASTEASKPILSVESAC